jgi:hypothetical protein
VDEIINIVNRVNRAILSDKAKRIALTSTLSQHKPRIFESGRDENGNAIGKYSTKYAALKSSIGRNPGYVNLQLTGQMAMDYGLVKNAEDYAFGFQNSVNADKMGYMQDKYGKGIAHLSDPELDLLTTVLNEEVNKEI